MGIFTSSIPLSGIAQTCWRALVRYLARVNGRIVTCLVWASAAWKVKSRDAFIGWDHNAKRQRLHLVANNTRFLILPWVQLKHLASKVLAESKVFSGILICDFWGAVKKKKLEKELLIMLSGFWLYFYPQIFLSTNFL